MKFDIWFVIYALVILLVGVIWVYSLNFESAIPCGESNTAVPYCGLEQGE